MPIYEFKCAACARRFEKLCALGETGEHVTCPNCGKPGPTRVMSSFAARGGTKGGSDGPDFGGGNGSGGGCAGCSSGSCATCGH